MLLLFDTCLRFWFLRMVWLSDVLEIATYCEVLALCCQEVWVCTEVSSTVVSQCISLTCLNDLKTGFYFWRVTLKRILQTKKVTVSKKAIKISITRRRGSLCFEKFGEEVFQSFHLFLSVCRPWKRNFWNRSLDSVLDGTDGTRAERLMVCILTQCKSAIPHWSVWSPENLAQGRLWLLEAENLVIFKGSIFYWFSQ